MSRLKLLLGLCKVLPGPLSGSPGLPMLLLKGSDLHVGPGKHCLGLVGRDPRSRQGLEGLRLMLLRSDLRGKQGLEHSLEVKAQLLLRSSQHSLQGGILLL